MFAPCGLHRLALILRLLLPFCRLSRLVVLAGELEEVIALRQRNHALRLMRCALSVDIDDLGEVTGHRPSRLHDHLAGAVGV